MKEFIISSLKSSNAGLQCILSFFFFLTGEAEAHNSDSICTTVVEQQSEESFTGGLARENRKNKLKIPDMLKKRNPKTHPKVDIPGTSNIYFFH